MKDFDDHVRPDSFDPVLHSAPRITIMSRLVVQGAMRFGALQKSTTLTAGNLAAHLRVLEEAGYVKLELDEIAVVRKRTVRITAEGDARFRAYVGQLVRILGPFGSSASHIAAESPQKA